MKRALAGILLSLSAMMVGCASKLDTGYEPTKLGSMTPDQRRGLYAPQFTEAAHAAPGPQQPSEFHRAGQGD